MNSSPSFCSTDSLLCVKEVDYWNHVGLEGRVRRVGEDGHRHRQRPDQEREGFEERRAGRGRQLPSVRLPPPRADEEARLQDHVLQQAARR